MNEQEQYWAGEAGEQYHARNNNVEWRLRAQTFFTGLIDITGARSVLEVGCGMGPNLSACRYDPRHHYVKTYGIEINQVAAYRAKQCGHEVDHPEMLPAYDNGCFDLTFTCGMLIHVPPVELPRMMAQIANASSRWVLSMEYHSAEETEIEYRGKKGLLWKRDYRKLYEGLGLKLHQGGFLGRETGFDDVTWFLMEK